MKKNNNYRFPKEKKKNWATTITLSIIGVLMTGLVVWIGMNGWDVEKSIENAGLSSTVSKEKSEEEAKDPSENEITDVDKVEGEPTSSAVVPKDDEVVSVEVEHPKTEYIEGQELPKKPTFKKDVLIANKQYPLPATYAPGESVEARTSFEEMAAEALLSGFNLTAFSTYRSYEYQVGLYERYTARDGVEEADRYSARPGYSEHQTGLAFDIGEVNNTNDWASQRFGESEAAKWLASNAHRYGFILRYPQGKEEVTGYMHESWHYRYVGKSIAENIYEENLTLEEYLGI